VDGKKVSVCSPPFTDDWFVSDQFTSTKELKDKFKLEDRFLLYPAATWEHKNHLNLIRALAVLKEERMVIQLLCAGNKTEFHSTIDREIKNIGLDSQINFLGIIPEEDLIGLYKSSSLVVIPTKYEAGSGPLYEAMRYSVPVICSNVTSLPDTIANQEFIFDPENITEIAAKIKKMLTNEDFRDKNVENSAQRLKELDKKNYIDNFINVYNSLT